MRGSGAFRPLSPEASHGVIHYVEGSEDRVVADRPLSPGAFSLFRRWYPVNCVVSVREACFVPRPDLVLVVPRVRGVPRA